MRSPVNSPSNISKSAPLPGSGILEYEQACEQSYKCEQKCSFTWIWNTWVWEVLWAVLQMWAKVLLYLNLEYLSMRSPVSSPTNLSKSAPLPGSGILEYEQACEQSYKCEQKCSFTWIWNTWVWAGLWAVLQRWAKVLLYLDREYLSMRRPVSSPSNINKSAPLPGSEILEYEKACEQSYKCEQKCCFTWIWNTWVW
jgi:hypothetical protein